MRTRNGKWIGPVPITLAAAFALAALLSVGLLVLAPNGVTAQTPDPPLITAKSTLPEQYVDIGKEFSVDVANLFTVDSTITGNRSWTATVPDNTLDDDDETEGRQGDEDTEPDALATGSALRDGPIEITAQEIQAVLGDVPGVETVDTASVGSLKVAITYDTGSTNEASSREFTLTVVHNPIEVAGDPFDIAQDGDANLAPHSCTLQTTGGTDPTYSVPNGAAITARATVSSPVMIEGGACTTSKDSLEVDFVNVATDGDDINHLVYVTGGSSFRSVQDLSGMFKTSGLNEEILTLSKQTISGVGKDTVTVSRSVANSDGFVYLIAYVAEANADNRIGATGKVFKGQAEFVIKVQFLGQAALGRDGSDEDNKVGAEEALSMLEAGAGIHTIDGFAALSDTDLAQVFDGTDATLLLTGTTDPEATSGYHQGNRPG